MTSQDEITRTADRLRDALGAAAELMTAGHGTVRGRRPKIRHSRGWLLPTSAAASIVAIAAVAVFVGQLTGSTGGPATAVGSRPVNVSAPPDPAVLNSPGVQAARGSVVKITGYAPSCTTVIEGSGFVYAPQHVMTDAHVVAGITRQGFGINTRGPLVTTAGGQMLASRVVFYDPRIDIAVLDVPGLNVAPLRFSTRAHPGDDAVLAGYPGNHALTAVPARIAKVIRVEGTDIYRTSHVDTQMYQIRALVQEGNSGGPLLSPGGTVDGVLYAAKAGVPHTGFALTASEIRLDAEAGATATAPVSTQGCT